MQDLKKQEQFEIEVLERLNGGRLLEKLVFTGGTMLRLCHGLDRYSVDLDFWVAEKRGLPLLYGKIGDVLKKYYRVNDSKDKFFSMLYEISSGNYPQKLKIEIRKEKKKVRTEKSIAYSRFSNIQVFLNACSLEDMMSMKVNAFLDRKEIRDVFDIEFMLKRGIDLKAEKKKLSGLLEGINALGRNDYKVKLGSLLDPKEREYYNGENFRITRNKIISII